jgi:sec-independent protein translocase protein TatA
MPGLDAPSHWIILLIVAAIVFGGYKKLPEMSRSVGRSLRIFKTEMKGLTEDDAARDAAEAQRTTADAPAPMAQPVAQVPPVPPVPPVVPTENPAAAPIAHELPQQQTHS